MQIFFARKENHNVIAKAFLMHLKKFALNNSESLEVTDKEALEMSKCELAPVRKKQKNTLYIPHEKIKDLLAVLKTEKEKIMLLLNYYCGLRIAELCGIREGDFNWDEWLVDRENVGILTVYNGKGGAIGNTYVPAFVMERIFNSTKAGLIKKPTSNNSYRFIDGKPRSNSEEDIYSFLRNKQRYWNYSLNQAGIDAGITKFDDQGKVIPSTSVYAHRLRHSFASHLLKDKDMDIRYIKEALRHKSIVSTQIYTQPLQEDLMEKLGTERDPSLPKPNAVIPSESTTKPL